MKNEINDNCIYIDLKDYTPEDIQLFFKKEKNIFKKNDVIFNLLDNKILNDSWKSILKKINLFSKKQNLSLVVITSENIYNKIITAPTKIEAKDIIELERIERDLNRKR